MNVAAMVVAPMDIKGTGWARMIAGFVNREKAS